MMKQQNIKLLLVLLISLLSVNASAHDIEVKNADGVTIYYTYINNNTELEVSYRGSSYDSYSNEYSGNVVIPESVTYNGKTYSVTSIGNYAFRYCSGLTSVTIPNSVTSIGNRALYDCSGLTSVTIGNSVTSIGGVAFYNCSGLTSITIPNSVTSIGGSAFRCCSGLTSVTIPNSVTSIGDEAFYYCSGLTSVTIGNSVTSIGEGAFCGCSGLTSVTIPNSVTSIGNYAFRYCSGLTSVTIPNSVTSIGYSAFADCSGLTSVTIPNSVTSIGWEAFRGCSGLTSVTIGNSVTSIGGYAFERTAWYNNQPDGLVYAGKVAYKYKGTMPSNTSIVIEEGTLGIADYAFNGCSGLTSVTIPNSVTSIGRETFYGTAWFNNQPDGLVYAGKVAYKYKGTMPSNTSIVIEEGTLVIGDWAFSGCSGLTSITIPNSVISIDSYAFWNCSGLTSVTIPNSVTSIGNSAFSDCSSLTSVTIPNSVTSIGDYAFSRCSGLTGVTIPNSVNSIGSFAFYNCSGLTSVTIPNSVNSIDYSAFSGCSGLTSITIPNSVTIIGGGAFSGCSGLTSITIPNSVTSIGGGAFSGCGLKEVKVLATKPPIAYDTTFSNYNILLYVPEASVSDYKSAYPWRKFSSFKTLTGGDVEVKKCATPVISYDNGRIVFSCATEGVEYSSSITDADVKSYTTSSIQLGATYTIRVIATKNGYQNSDEATATFSWNGISPVMAGETAKYRLSFIVDNKELKVQNVAYGSSITAPSTDGEGNTVTWYTYPATMPAHDLVVYGMVVKPEPAPAPAKYTLTYMLDGQQYKQVTIEAGAAVAKETAPSKEGYTFSGWQNEPATMPAQNTTVTGRFTINSYRLSFIAENRELSSKNVTYGSSITAPSTDSEGNTISWYTYPATMPAHDLVVYGMVVKQPEPEVLVWLTVKDGQGTTRMKVRQGTEQVLTITPEEGWKVISVTLDGVDVTAQVKDGSSYTTPAIMSDATLTVVYEQDRPSDVASARAGQATVTVVDDGVVIAHAEPQSRCVVYTSNGLQVVSTVIEGDNQKIRLQKGQVYILTINGRTLKFAL